MDWNQGSELESSHGRKLQKPRRLLKRFPADRQGELMHQLAIDIPPSEEELFHTAEVFKLACRSEVYDKKPAIAGNAQSGATV